MSYEISLPSLSALLNFDDNVKEANAAAAGGLHRYLAAYIGNLDNDHNNPFGPAYKTHFYRHAADGITEEIRDDGSDVIINQTGFRQRLLGGEIHAKPGHNLTIPAIAEAYGHRATEFDFLHFIMFKSGSKALAAHTKEDHRVWYWLVESVTQEADPTVLPTEEAMHDAAKNSMLAYLNGTTLAGQTGSIYQNTSFVRSTEKY